MIVPTVTVMPRMDSQRCWQEVGFVEVKSLFTFYPREHRREYTVCNLLASRITGGLESCESKVVMCFDCAVRIG